MNKYDFLKLGNKFAAYVRNTGWLLFEQLFRMVMALFVGVWVARYLGTERFGLYSYSFSFVMLFTTIGTLGLDEVVTRELIRRPFDQNNILGTAFLLRVLGSFLMIFIILLVLKVQSSSPEVSNLVYILSVSIALQSFRVVDFYFQAKVLSRFVVIANSFSVVVSNVLKIIFILNEMPLILFVWVFFVENILACTFSTIFFLKNNKGFNYKHLTFNLPIARSLLRDSWPYIFSGLLVTVYMKIDQVMIKELKGAVEVGVYAAAVRLSEVWYFIPIAISSSLFPAIIEAKENSIEKYKDSLQRLYDLMVLMAFAISIVLTFFSDFIVQVVYGESFNEASSILTIHVWTGAFVFLGVVSGKWFLSENLRALTILRTVCGVIVNIILNFALIPKLGGKGAAIATLLSQVTSTYLFDVITFKTREMFFMKTESLLLVNSLRYLFNKIKLKIG